jgi:hypothetical protein
MLISGVTGEGVKDALYKVAGHLDLQRAEAIEAAGGEDEGGWNPA